MADTPANKLPAPAPEAPSRHEAPSFDYPPAKAHPLDVRDIATEDIAENANIRRPTYYGIEEMAESLYAQGQLHPICVRPSPSDAEHDKPFELIFGHRRLAAAKNLGWDTIRCDVRTPEDKQHIIELMITENLQRENMSAIAEAVAMQELLDLGLNQADIARRLGKDPSHVSHRLNLLSLSPKVMQQIDAGKISPSHGEALAALPEEKQEKFATKVASEGATVEKLTNWVRLAKEDLADAPPDDLAPLEDVMPDDVIILPHLTLRDDLTDQEYEKATIFALLRNGNDNEMLEWLREKEGVEYDALWGWVRNLTNEEAVEFRQRLVRRYLEAGHRYPIFEPTLIEDLAADDFTAFVEEEELIIPSREVASDDKDDEDQHDEAAWSDDDFEDDF